MPAIHNLAGRAAIITGASSGIGAASARAFAAHGVHLTLGGRDAPRLLALARSLPQLPLLVPGDLRVAGTSEVLVARAIAAWGRLDVLVANAGAGLAAPVLATARADLDALFALNLHAPLELIQAALPHMPRGGRVIVVSSVVGLRALPYAGAYAASKAALDCLIEALRVEVRDRGITVSLVRPSTTATAFTDHERGAGRAVRRVSPAGVAPARVAQVIVRCAQHGPRVAWVRRRDRLLVLASLLFPGITDALLAHGVRWAVGGGRIP